MREVPDPSLWDPRERRSLNGLFSIRGPSIIAEGSKNAVFVIANGDGRVQPNEKVTVEAPGPLVVFVGGRARTELEFESQPGGNKPFFVTPDGKVNRFTKGHHAVEAAFTVQMPRPADSATASVCITRGQLTVLRESISLGDATLVKITSSAVVAAIAALIPVLLFFITGITAAIVTTVMEGFIAAIIAFFVWKNVLFGREQQIAEVLEKTRRYERFGAP